MRVLTIRCHACGVLEQNNKLLYAALNVSCAHAVRRYRGVALCSALPAPGALRQLEHHTRRAVPRRSIPDRRASMERLSHSCIGGSHPWMTPIKTVPINRDYLMYTRVSVTSRDCGEADIFCHVTTRLVADWSIQVYDSTTIKLMQKA